MVRDAGFELRPDPSRVISRLFVPGWEDVGPGDSRAAPVIERILALDEAAVEATMHDIDARFTGRHHRLHATFEQHAAAVTSRLGPAVELSASRRLLLGACFTHEYAIEGAALCNPSAVLHPVQPDDGSVAFLFSVRGIGEGHRSSIGFRTGSVSAAGVLAVDEPDNFPSTIESTDGLNHRAVFHTRLDDLDEHRENAAFVLSQLAEQFTDAELEIRLEELAAGAATRKHTDATIEHLRELARSSYSLAFPESSHLSERVLWPQSPTERHGMEDARLVRFTDDDGAVSYYGTYTAFDGTNIAQHVLTTLDFRHFHCSPMAGAGAVGKGLALFPRKVNGRYAALSRSDRETNSVAFSDDIRCWPDTELIQSPKESWEVLQLGNCGSPIETERGWLVLTHGVGAMRTYAIGAILLALDDPSHVVAIGKEQLVRPSSSRRDGYVPNVVYSCGGFASGDTLVLPYGVGDQTIAFATMSIVQLLDSMTRTD
jgi:predicted GH43/DUF377 family glycosyl hydrolase